MGAIEHATSYGLAGEAMKTAYPTYGFVYIGTDPPTSSQSLSVSGTGTYANAFTTWGIGALTPGSANGSQSFEAPDVTNPPPGDISMEIGDIWFEGLQVHFTVEGTDSARAPYPTYNTNLNFDVWVPAPGAGSLTNGTTYEVWCDVVTKVPGAFYRIEFDDTP